LAERLGDGRYRMYTRSHTLSSPTSDEQEIYRTALSLYTQVPRQRQKVRLAGIYASSLESERNTEQLSLFAQPTTQSDKRRQLGQLLDQLSSRYGEGVVRLGETPTTARAPQRDPGSFRKEELIDPLTTKKEGR
jgi:hypothetical protein